LLRKGVAVRHVLTRPEQMWNGAERNGIRLFSPPSRKAIRPASEAG